MTSATAAATRSIVVEREMPYPAERIWRALTEGPLIEQWLMKNDFQPGAGTCVRMKHSGFRAEDEGGYQAMSFGWPRVLANLERVAGEVSR
jgi:uncharacterized protein YndB with AHSA1/START domain